MGILHNLKFSDRMAAELTDKRLLNLSKRVTSEGQLMDLGIKVLDLPRDAIQSALYDKKEIQPAAFKVLHSWHQKHENAEEAFIKLRMSLRQNRMNLLAAELSSPGQGCRIPSKLSEHSMFVLFIR